MSFLSVPLSSQHRVAVTADDLSAMVREMRSAPERGLDYETAGLRYADGQLPIGAGLGHLAGGQPRCWYVPFGHRTAERQANPEAAKAAIKDALIGAQAVIGQNVKFELHMSKAWAGEVIPEQAQIHDTLIQAHLIYELRPSFGLESLAADEGISPWEPFEAKRIVEDCVKSLAKGRRLPWKAYLNKYGHSEMPVSVEAEYCCRDVAHALLLDRAQRPRAMGAGMGDWGPVRRVLYANEMLLVRALHEMEYAGQLCDASYLRQLAVALDEDLERRGNELRTKLRVGVDWGNDSAVRDWLYGYRGMAVRRKTDKGLPSVDQSALLDCLPQIPEIAEIVEWKIRAKVRSTYTDSMADRVCSDGRLHASYLQWGTKTGRFSGADPNLQNIPVRNKEMATALRRAFRLPERQVRLFTDYSQVELRMLGYVTGCPAFCDTYMLRSYNAMLRGELTYEQYVEARKLEPAADIHTEVTKRVFGVAESDPNFKNRRRAAKVINFGIPYGGGEDMLVGNVELRLSQSEAKQYLLAYHHANPEIKAAQRALFQAMLRRKDTSFTNWAGRTRHGPGLRYTDDDARAEEERSLFASLVQGSAGELTRFLLVRLYMLRRAGQLPAVSTSTIHDEVQVDCDKKDLPVVAPLVRKAAEDFHYFNGIPIIVDQEVTETNWAEKYKYEA